MALPVEIEKNLHIGILLDLYGELLTERQRDIMEMYFHDDLSLSEIAEQNGISRQGVHDAVRRGAEALEEYEQKLGLAVQQEAQKAQLLEFKGLALEALEECRKVSFGKNIADKVIALLEDLDKKLEEFENTSI